MHWRGGRCLGDWYMSRRRSVFLLVGVVVGDFSWITGSCHARSDLFWIAAQSRLTQRFVLLASGLSLGRELRSSERSRRG
jgi:hypothetical protein